MAKNKGILGTEDKWKAFIRLMYLSPMFDRPIIKWNICKILGIYY